MDLTTIAILAFIILVGASLLVLTSRSQKEAAGRLRPHAGFHALQQQVGRAVESGRPIHLSLGRGTLSGRHTATSAAALTTLHQIAEGSCLNGMPATVTTGDGTLLLAGQDQVRHVYEQAKQPTEYQASMVQFQASANDAIPYAAGAAQQLNQQPWGSNILTGQFGPEIALLTEAGSRAQAKQIVSTDDPVALAVAYPTADALIVGEEHLAAAAYLQGKPAQIASLRLQDMLRWLAAAALIIATLIGVIAGL